MLGSGGAVEGAVGVVVFVVPHRGGLQKHKGLGIWLGMNKSRQDELLTSLMHSSKELITSHCSCSAG